jgi:Rieske 2Fe-2S family protein
MSPTTTAASLAEDPVADPSAERLLERLLAGHKPGHGLAREFHTEPEIYRLDLARIWRRSWLFAGHTCQVKQPGDFFLFDLDTDSIILVRDADGRLHGLHNTCRHRGMRVCHDDRGRVQAFVCPYHQWTYARSGALLACGGMDRDGDVDRAAFGLHPVHVREVEGLIFVNLAADPAPFDPAAEAIAPMLRPQGLDRARVAAMRRYEVKANWKLVWENNRECWHCPVNHPQYVKANYDAAPADAPAVRHEIAARARAAGERLAAAGLAIDHQEAGLYRFPSVDRWWSANRTPLTPGWVTESLDGRPVAPLMGAYPAPDVGTLRLRTVPNFWNHSSGDHAVSTRLAPGGPGLTRIEVQWLVHEDAVEGRDYDLATLLPFWQLTSEQDWSLCERNQAGVSSSAFVPGPYSRTREYNVISYVEWYLHAIARGAPAAARPHRVEAAGAPAGTGPRRRAS